MGSGFDCVDLNVSELVTIQSQEENEFILKYSPEVWKGNTNVWLGMYYDTSSEYCTIIIMHNHKKQPIRVLKYKPQCVQQASHSTFLKKCFPLF